MIMKSDMKTIRKNCLLFLFDGFSDWEISYATVGIRKSSKVQLKTISMDLDPVRSMGGLRTMPDTDFRPADLADIDATNTAMLILPGGTAWERGSNDAITPLVAHCVWHGIPIAAICGATLFLADAGLLNRAPHTSNDISYLESFSRPYTGRAFYLNEPAVNAGNIITAGGASPVEFASEIFGELGIRTERDVSDWFGYFDKHLIAV
jgi:putative intracellular protease/amidase